MDPRFLLFAQRKLCGSGPPNIQNLQPPHSLNKTTVKLFLIFFLPKTKFTIVLVLAENTKLGILFCLLRRVYDFA